MLKHSGRNAFFVGALAVLCVAAPVALAEEIRTLDISPVVGTWLSVSQSEITIEACENGYCGYISKIVVPPELIAKYGEDKIAELEGNYFDFNNEDPALRNRPIMGLQILTLQKSGDPHRLEGRIYNPENGKTYDGVLEVLSEDVVRLNGCVMFGVICKGEEWTRVDTPDPDMVVADATS